MPRPTSIIRRDCSCSSMHGQDPDPPGRPREPTVATFRRRGGLQPLPQTVHHVVCGQRSGFPGSQFLRCTSALGTLQLHRSRLPSFTAAIVLVRLRGSPRPSCMAAFVLVRLRGSRCPSFTGKFVLVRRHSSHRPSCMAAFRLGLYDSYCRLIYAKAPHFHFHARHRAIPSAQENGLHYRHHRATPQRRFR